MLRQARARIHMPTVGAYQYISCTIPIGDASRATTAARVDCPVHWQPFARASGAHTRDAGPDVVLTPSQLSAPGDRPYSTALELWWSAPGGPSPDSGAKQCGMWVPEALSRATSKPPLAAASTPAADGGPMSVALVGPVRLLQQQGEHSRRRQQHASPPPVGAQLWTVLPTPLHQSGADASSGGSCALAAEAGPLLELHLPLRLHNCSRADNGAAPSGDSEAVGRGSALNVTVVFKAPVRTFKGCWAAAGARMLASLAFHEAGVHGMGESAAFGTAAGVAQFVPADLLAMVPHASVLATTVRVG
jgi:hypothetical protein